MRGEITADTAEIQKKERILWTIVCQQTGELRKKGQLSTHIQPTKTGSGRSAKPPCKQNPGADDFTGKFFQTLKKKKTFTDPSQTLPEYWRERNTPRDILWSHHHPNTKIKDITKKENYRPISLMNIDTKILNKIANWIQQYKKRSYTTTKLNSFQGHKDGST